jgi:serine/threonine protein kinase
MLSGGRLLDQGFYGCIFTPALACKAGTEERLGEEKEGEKGSALTKLLSVEDAKQEFQIAKRIHRIPFHRQYFVTSDAMCEPAAVQPKERELDKCVMREREGEESLRLLRMRYAGKALHMASFSVQTFDLRAFAVHLIAAGALMNLFGVVHRDLHQGNVLVDTYHVPRIIDFNLSVPVQTSHKATASDLSHKYDMEITQEPPDSTLVNAIAHGENPMSVIQAICYKKPVMRKVTSLLGVSPREMYQRLAVFYRKSKSARTGDLAQWFSLYYRVVDSWAIGVMLVELIHRISLWPRVRSQVKGLLPVLRKMCAVHPMERVDCVQALQMVDPNHIVLRRYGAKWLEIVGKA